MVHVEQLTEVTQSNVAELNELMRSLRVDQEVVNAMYEEVQRILADPHASVVAAKDGDRIIGVASLYLIHKIGKITGHIEDVVVLDSYRRQGLGEQMIYKIIEIARERKAKSVSLTSRFVHVEAHRLYEKVGFEKKEAQVFRYRL